MNQLLLTPEDLLSGAEHTYEIAIPLSILHPSHASDQGSEPNSDMMVQLRPLTIGTFQLIMKAARQDTGLIPLLMIKEALVEPPLSLEQVKRLHLGLVNFLIDQIRQISGLTEKKSPSVA